MLKIQTLQYVDISDFQDPVGDIMFSYTVNRRPISRELFIAYLESGMLDQRYNEDDKIILRKAIENVRDLPEGVVISLD